MQNQTPKTIILLFFLSLILVTLTAGAFAADELRPSQKLMRERAAWLEQLVKNQGLNQYEAIVKDADALAAQTQKVAAGLANPQAKELTLAVSALAAGLSSAAVGRDSATVTVKLGELKAKCNECHGQFRK